MKTRALWAVVLVVAFGSGLLNAQNERRDGNWWNDRQRPSKLWYALGFFDGINLGNGFSRWKLADDPCLAKVTNSFDDYSKKYLEKVTSDQLVDGLDEFYKDYQNRSITVGRGIWIVLNSIAGMPKGELEKLIESYRRNPG